jgi:hypothetical protein
MAMQTGDRIKPQDVIDWFNHKIQLVEALPENPDPDVIYMIIEQ